VDFCRECIGEDAVYVRKRINRSQFYLRKLRKYKVPLFLLACAATFLITFSVMRSVTRPVATIPFKAPAASAGIPKANKQTQTASYERLVYPYSIIPGGIRSKADLITSIAKDPIVAEHYRNFDLNQVKFYKSDAPQFVHVAYRLKNKVYWTAKTLEIPAGETLISDGNNVARTRCGNKIVAGVLDASLTTPEEPPPTIFDIPLITTGEPQNLDVSSMDDIQAKPIEPHIPPLIHPQLYNLQYDTKRPLAAFPQNVPEPGTLGLMASGLAVILAFKFARRK
jgi:hypothetical protein